jgi:hypothetical protein
MGQMLDNTKCSSLSDLKISQHCEINPVQSLVLLISTGSEAD